MSAAEPLVLLLLLLLLAAQDVMTAAFQQQPFSTAAVCEVAIRGAARHNELSLERVRVFAALTMMALNESCEEAEPVGSSTCGAMVAAAASDHSTRDALLLQHGLIMTQLKHASISCGGTSVFSGLFHHLVPTVRALVRLTSHIDHRFNSSSGSSSSGGVEKQRVQLQTLLPWVHLCGRCMFFAGSQLLRVMEEPAATEAPGLRDGCPIAVQQVKQGPHCSQLHMRRCRQHQARVGAGGSHSWLFVGLNGMPPSFLGLDQPQRHLHELYV